ncbi:MAG: hypothetical protein NC123_02365 [Butyrivibrio sp.]|nr:hypothetical protein [Acetatifactor muris]MCM1558384.1 hypothetical protein [Butyrivibrio sp.]
MPTGIEVIKAALDDFKKIQRYMLLAKKENAAETYAELKEEYLTIKALFRHLISSKIRGAKPLWNHEGFAPFD